MFNGMIDWLARRSADKALAEMLTRLLEPRDGWALSHTPTPLRCHSKWSLAHAGLEVVITFECGWVSCFSDLEKFKIGVGGAEPTPVPPGAPEKAVRRAAYRIKEDIDQQQQDAAADTFEKGIARHLLSLAPPSSFNAVYDHLTRELGPSWVQPGAILPAKTASQLALDVRIREVEDRFSRSPLGHYWQGKKIVSYDAFRQLYLLEGGEAIDALSVRHSWGSLSPHPPLSLAS